VRFGWKYTPCAELAGDFLNFFPLDEQHVGLYVVDVSGHGAASSLLAVAIGRFLTPHASASSLLVRRNPGTSALCITPPGAVAAELNRLFPMEGQGGLYFTLLYGVLNTATLELRTVSAGHPPLVYHPRGGEPELLPAEGFPVGVMDDVDFEEKVLPLRPGDRVYFYSDGVPEAMNEQLEQFENERMLSELGRSSGRPVAEGVEELFEAVRRWCVPNGPKDDVSILGCEIIDALPPCSGQ
jgi:sigma-B regulation protein RsbU (phosphoserine phosphatase)